MFSDLTTSTLTFVPVMIHYYKCIKNKNLGEKNHKPFFLTLLGLGGEKYRRESSKAGPAGFTHQDPGFWSFQGFGDFPQFFCS